MSTLFDQVTLGGQLLSSRIVMAPMTRCRASQPGDVPNTMMAEYYAQRASAGLIVTEATQISPQGKGYSFTPGIYSQAQIQGWKQVTRAVKRQGGIIYNQLWHVGRVSHPSFHGGELPVAPSAMPFKAQVWVYNEATQQGEKLDCPTPRALEIDEIKAIVGDYEQAALNAMEAGFDGVEIHGANGYLIDQFLRTSSNCREDEYGGTRTNRLRFLREVVTAVVDAIGASHVGIRLAPFITAKGMSCPDILPTILDAAEWLQSVGVSYIHLAEADWEDAPQVGSDFRAELRHRFKGKVIVAGKMTTEKAQALLDDGLADLFAFGRPFIANPDLPEKLKAQMPLAPISRPELLFGGGTIGYTDYGITR